MKPKKEEQLRLNKKLKKKIGKRLGKVILGPILSGVETALSPKPSVTIPLEAAIDDDAAEAVDDDSK